jgi:hypothetical protein
MDSPTVAALDHLTAHIAQLLRRIEDLETAGQPTGNGMADLTARVAKLEAHKAAPPKPPETGAKAAK